MADEGRQSGVGDHRLERVASAAPAVVFTADPAGERMRPTWVSGNIERVLGYSVDEALAPDWWSRNLHPDDRPDASVARANLERTGRHEAEYRFRHADGTYHRVCEQLFLRTDGDSPSVIGSWVDVTASKQQAQQLEAAESHYRRLITTSPYAVYMLSADGRFTEINPAAERLLGATASDLIGRHFDVVLPPASLEQRSTTFQRMSAGELEYSQSELTIQRPSGEHRVIVAATTAIRANDQFQGMHGIARDITEERVRDQRVRMLAEALDRLPDGVSIERDDGSIMYANAAYRELIGDATDGHEGLQALLDHAMPAGERAAIRHRLTQAGSWRGRTLHHRAGARIPLEIVARRLELDQHEVTILLARDVSEQTGREMQLRRAERLASIGTLVGGVAHELNNPLTAIAGFIELMLAEPRTAEDCEALETMRREAARVAKIVSDLRLLARESQDVAPRDRRPVDLNDIIRHVVKVRRYALETGNIEVHLDLAPSLPPALGVPSELEQIVLNLVVNASQALEASPRPHRKLTVRSGATRTGVAFEVIDNGTGIPERDVERIFDPFFTTKSPGEGTGLGLSLVHSIVSEHAGRISVNSIEGRGTTFSVWLPLATAAEERQPSPTDQTEPSHRTLHILVVDDEPAIRLALVRHLRRRGHIVDAVGDGAEALERITTTPFDVIVSDIRMPGMSGDRLLRRLLEDDASDAVRRLLFMTGDPASEATHRALGGHEVPVVPKPFTLAEITRAIEERSVSRGGGGDDRPAQKD